MSNRVLSIAPFEYIHVMNKNTNIKRLIIGPVNFALEDHETIVSNFPEKMIVIPNLQYVEILNPIVRDSDGNVVKDKYGLEKYQRGIVEVRTRDEYKVPFSLHPEERLEGGPKPLTFINSEEALHLKCLVSFIDGMEERTPGEEWYFEGPSHYIPRYEVQEVRKVRQVTIEKNQAIRLRANRNTFDSNKQPRKAGEEWLIRREGAYLPNVSEDFVRFENADILDDKTALHLQALFDYTDIYGVERKAGEEWLITSEMSNMHICDVYEKKIDIESLVVVGADEYCVLVNPYDPSTRKNQLGKVKLVQGVANFFLNPGEILSEGKVQKVNILTEDESLLLQAIENFKNENTGKVHKAGDKWMIHGPLRFIPPVEVKILDKRNLIPLDKNEGIYIRNLKTGKLRKHMGSSYSLKPEEELWKKELPEVVEKIYLRDLNLKSRDKTRIVAYKCPFNAIMQIYNMKENSNRIVFGPELAVLDPDEEFTLMTLSGKTPKVENIVQTLYLKLGPIFSTDEFNVETVDHTRLLLKISYNWLFDIEHGNEADALKIFTIRDFVGDMCLTLASKIRSYIANLIFEDFHKNSDRIIKRAVFGETENGEINSFFRYKLCHLMITDVDIQSVTPTDPTTMRLLQKSVSLAIELATKSIEQEYRIQALIKEQEFAGELEKLKIENEIQYLKKLQELSKLEVDAKVIEKNGSSRIKALAEKEGAEIESKSKVLLAEMTRQAKETETEFEIKKIVQEFNNIYLRLSEEQRLELKKTIKTNNVEAMKFKNIMMNLGPDTLVEIAKAGPELQSKLLSGLNMNGYILTDGNNPINLFNVANNLVKSD